MLARYKQILASKILVGKILAGKILVDGTLASRILMGTCGQRWILVLGVLGLLTCMEARQSPRYITDSKDFSTIGIDRHDMDLVAETITSKLLESSFVREIQGQKLLAIADLSNLTEEDIDVEFVSRKIARTLRKSKKFTLTNAIAGSGSSTDKLITESRKLTKDKRFNQYTTQENGTLLAPELSLSGKIIQRKKSVGDSLRVDYDFLFVITDLKSGRVVWDNEVNIAKAIDKSQAARFSKLGAGTCEGGEVLACQREAQAALDAEDPQSAQELFARACSLGNRQACENAAYIKQELKRAQKEAKKARRQARGGRFGIAVGADGGMGDGKASMAPIPYSYTHYGEEKHGYIIYNNKTAYNDMATWTYMLKAGFYYQQSNGIYLSLDALYGGYTFNAANSDLAFDCTAIGYSCGYQDFHINSLDFKHQFVGARGRIGAVTSSDDNSTSLIAFIGGGVLKDINSSMRTQGSGIISKTLENLFPFWEIGTMLTLSEVFFIETSYRHLFDGEDFGNWASIGSFNIGLGFMLPIW